MPRWLLAGGLLVVLFFACKPKSYTDNNGDDAGGDDAGDDGGVCTCDVPTTIGQSLIPCGQSACVGTIAYQCTQEGIPLAGTTGACGGGSDAAFMEEGQCLPSCTGTTCGGSDHCGGTCSCAAGVPCNPNGTCGNGCDLGPGEICLGDDAGPTTCCSFGYQCRTSDAGASACCAPNADGICTQDTDCCNYPMAHCSTTSHTCG